MNLTMKTKKDLVTKKLILSCCKAKLYKNEKCTCKNILNKYKGSLCSINGNNYEKQIYNILSKCYIDDRKFNTQKQNELGGSSSKNDLICNYKKENDIGIEVKKCNTPDWMQCSIKYDFENKCWKGSENSKIPLKSKKLFNKFINNINIYDGKIPPFMKKKITHKEWLSIKQNTNQWDDVYFDVPNDTINKLYKHKGCQYIQISDYGLYYLDNDICNFNVPIFVVDQQLRVRTKIHCRKNKQGYCNLSVIVACQPKNIKLLPKSPYSLDSVDNLPLNLSYDFNQ